MVCGKHPPLCRCLLGRRRTTMGRMEILMSLDRKDPPEGRLRCVARPRAGDDEAKDREIPFLGWLVLLRALSEVLDRSGVSRPFSMNGPSRLSAVPMAGRARCRP